MTRLVTLLGYVVLAASAAGLELAARRRTSGGFGDAVTIVMSRWPARVIVLAVWLWLGWHLFARVDWR